MFFRKIFPAFFAALFFLAACGGFPDEFPAADFTLPDIFEGPPIRLADYRDRPVIIYWMTSW